MMQQAAYVFGFEAEDIPLMIEAIPASSDSIVLIITKVEDPDELDTRFSKFAPSPSDDSGQKKYEALDKLEGAETLLNLLGKVKEKMEAVKQSSASDKQPAKEEGTVTLRLFSFSAMEHVLQAAQLLGGMYHGSNSLYKDTAENVYILAIMQSDHSINDFNRICNMLTEFGTLEKSSGASLAFLEEHCESLLSNDAIQQLSAI